MSIPKCFEYLEGTTEKCENILSELHQVYDNIPNSLVHTTLHDNHKLVPVSSIQRVKAAKTKAYASEVQDALRAFQHKLELLKGEEQRMRTELESKQEENKKEMIRRKETRDAEMATETFKAMERECNNEMENNELLSRQIRSQLRKSINSDPDAEVLLSEFSSCSLDVDALQVLVNQLPHRECTHVIEHSEEEKLGLRKAELKQELAMYKKRLKLLAEQAANEKNPENEVDQIVKEELDESLLQMELSSQEAKEERDELDSAKKAVYSQLVKVLQRTIGDSSGSKYIQNVVTVLATHRATSEESALRITDHFEIIDGQFAESCANCVANLATTDDGTIAWLK